MLATKVAQDCDKSCRVTLLDHLEQTYQWLNKHSNEAEPFLRRCTADTIALFLNVDSPPEEMRTWNWKSANEIVLNDTDSGPFQHPRGFIKPYRHLLEAAGAEAINHGEMKAPLAMPRVEDGMSSMRMTLDKMRKNGVCTDMCFTFASPGEKPLPAHRTYLAMYSPHFLGLFSVSSGATKIPVTHSRRCVEHLLGKFDFLTHTAKSHVEIDYAYTAKEPVLKNDQSDRKLALEMLSLAHQWSMSDAQRVIQHTIITLKMVDPFTLNDGTSSRC